ncbi:helix-turn-helix transcriptional regulator [Halorubrum ezzemoulense]|uniref:helix-turn-helix transcriptional regulator n=1 Tax=Halorubrum ezzemoulense TaxID=337243 RepID=UPI00232B8D08|nr:helix-turn-helix transcriptional regulator [Halorubrum ezzemoulense]MDB9281736.1 helix-turn-helix transcriptional regulator [Halorubrum ezzemoulense]MDB9285266.1 helix-turn-helix transcriptional regulator [Halorubrum ezzemoulense]
MTTRYPAAPERGVRLIASDSNASAAGIVCTAVSPRLTEWVPELLTKLRPRSQRTVRRHATTEKPFRASAAILSTTLPEWNTTTDTWGDDTAEAVSYTRAIATLALTYAEEDSESLSAYHRRRYADLTDTVESVGTGRGPVNGDLGALAKGPVALHRELDDHPQTLTLFLDGETWTDLTDRRTGVRALAAIAVLADGFDVRVVASPALQRELTRRYPAWSEIHLGLTGDRDRSHRDHRRTPSQPAPTDDTHPAWAALNGLATTPGKRRLLGNLDTDRERSYRDLEQDHAIDIEAGTVSRYVLDLEDRGLVMVDRRGQHNTVSLSELGDTAVSQCLDANDELIHPNQRQLDARLTDTPHDGTSTVSPRREGQPGTTPTGIDEWIAATGDPDGDADYVQWLTGPEESPETQSVHRRFTVPANETGITLVDDHPAPFDDGRVTYLSHHAETALVVSQWGGPLVTLGRLAAALLSDKALSKILTPSRVGRDFTAIHDGATDSDPGRTLRRGHQVGWFSEDETTYTAWRQRVETVRDTQLARLAALTDSDDTAARSDLFEALHGLVASATHLYHAAGIDLTATIRLPDTDAVARNPTRLENLCEFLSKTVPKQSVYGIHSGYRMLFEERPAKLCRRLPYDIDPTDHLDLTMSWVLAGPTITALHDEITTTLKQELTAVREAIADGTEDAPTLAIPVRDATTYPAIRRVLEEVAMTHDVQWTPRERQRLVRLCLRSFGPSDTHGACPYDVVVSLQRALNESPNPTPAAVERAAATLPPERFRPDLTPTATKLYAALLRADTPLGRSELLDRADISASSYDRRLSAVRELDRVRPVQVDGHRRWTTTATRTSRTPPVTAWLPPNRGTTTPLVTHRRPLPPTGQQHPIETKRGRHHPPPTLRITTPNGATPHTTYPMNLRHECPQSHRTDKYPPDSRDTHANETMAATAYPTTAVATPHQQPQRSLTRTTQ